MIVAPVKALFSTEDIEQLASVLEDVMRCKYPSYDKKAWILWAAQYKSFRVARRCAIAMYQRLV